MLIQKIVLPFVRQHRQVITGNKLPCIQIYKRCKNSKPNSLTTSTKTDLDTNVKPLGEKVKETTKTASYLGIILLGFAVTGSLFYAVFNELFSSKSPNNVYSKTVKKCLGDPRIQDKLGVPIKSYGEETSRRRRRRVSHLKYVKDDKQHLRMIFYLQGTFHKGTVHLEMCENESGDYEYRYLFVEVEDLARTTIILEDNRNKLNHKETLPASDFSFY